MIIFGEQFLVYFMFVLVVLVNNLRSRCVGKKNWVYIKSGIIICLYQNYSKIVESMLKVVMCVKIGNQMYI